MTNVSGLAPRRSFANRTANANTGFGQKKNILRTLVEHITHKGVELRVCVLRRVCIKRENRVYYSFVIEVKFNVKIVTMLKVYFTGIDITFIRVRILIVAKIKHIMHLTKSY